MAGEFHKEFFNIKTKEDRKNEEEALKKSDVRKAFLKERISESCLKAMKEKGLPYYEIPEEFRTNEMKEYADRQCKEKLAKEIKIADIVIEPKTAETAKDEHEAVLEENDLDER